VDQRFRVDGENAGGGLACASRHPEGGEDGRVRNFVCAVHRGRSLEAAYKTYLAEVPLSKTTSGSVTAMVVHTGERRATLGQGMIVPQLMKTKFVSIRKCEPSECRSALKTARS
jgi:hypothetical protein